MRSEPRPSQLAYKFTPKRRHVHGHNMLHGGVRMIEVWARQIAERSSVTPKGRELASEILTRALQLRTELKTRIDP